MTKIKNNKRCFAEPQLRRLVVRSGTNMNVIMSCQSTCANWSVDLKRQVSQRMPGDVSRSTKAQPRLCSPTRAQAALATKRTQSHHPCHNQEARFICDLTRVNI